MGLRRGGLLGRLEWRVGAVLAIISVLLPYLSRNVALQNASAGFVTLLSTLIPLVTAVSAHFILADERLKALSPCSVCCSVSVGSPCWCSGETPASPRVETRRWPDYSGSSAWSRCPSLPYMQNATQVSYSVLGVTGIQLGARRRRSGSPGHSCSKVRRRAPRWSAASAWRTSGCWGTSSPLALYFYLIRHVTVTYSTIIGYVVPFVAVFAGVLILDERIQTGIAVGGTLVLLGVVVTDLVRIRDARREASV